MSFFEMSEFLYWIVYFFSKQFNCIQFQLLVR